MTVRLRQVALVAADLAAAEEQITARLGLELCFNDPGVGQFGLVNALFAIGDQLLEVVSPATEGTTAGRLIERRGGDGGYMVIVQASRAEQARLLARLPDLGIRVVWHHDYDDIGGLHLHPRDIGGAIVSIDWAEPIESWRWGGPVWHEHVRTDVVSAMAGVVIGANDPAAMAARWAEALDAPLDGPTSVKLADAVLRFEPAGPRGEGVDGLLLHATDRSRAGDRLNLVGMTIELV